MSVPADTVTVTGLRGFGHHGVYEHEKREGQEFTADVTLYLDTRVAAASDDVRDTVHYGDVSDAVVAVITGDPVDLVETLCARIAEAVLSFAGVTAVTVTVHKPHAPITVPFEDVAVTIHRAREQA